VKLSEVYRPVKALVVAYVALSVATLVVAYALRHHPQLVTDGVWIRGGIVALSSLLTLRFVLGAARGSRRMWIFLRIGSATMVVAIVVVVAVSGLIPDWMKVEQVACGLLLLAVVVIVNGQRVRSLSGPR
jgi:tellurite resistance protein TehA-like permease